MNKISGWDDTIVAPATAAGVAAIAVIRLSGTKAFAIINHLMPSKHLLEKPSHTLHYGILKYGEEKIDEVVVSLYRQPHSFTGEDVIEISCHGSIYIQQRIVDVCIAHGARIAKPGEFTQRAFLNGKIDLTQAEAVGDMIAANSAASQRTALNQMRGGFSKALKAMREQLIQFAALIELELDFATEDVEFADRKQLYELMNQIEEEATQLSDSFALGNVIKRGVTVAIIGKPNAGKSTLLNTLLNESRAIVSEVAGTTRDTIEEVMNINGILFRLIDTAGIRESSDLIERIGVEKSIEKMNEADVIVYLFDSQIETELELRKQEQEFISAKKTYLLVGNKVDINLHQPLEKVTYISAREKKGIEELKQELFNACVQRVVGSEDVVVTNARHYAALQEILQSIKAIQKGLDEGRSGDLLSADIRNVLFSLGEITGEVTNEDKLDYIFSKFCIGK